MTPVSNDYSVIGYVGDNADSGRPVGKKTGNRHSGTECAGERMLSIPNKIRQNFAIFGEIGSGKSSILRLLILQDIQAGRGFLLAENHNELSREILSMIPPDQYHKIVYVNLTSLRKWDKTMRFNPLRCDDPVDSGMVALTFTECMARAFSDSWGARVETCTRNGALATIGTSSNTIGVMLKLLTDKAYREAFVPTIQNKQARDFFLHVYDEQYPKEAGGVVFNKLNKMMTIPEMDAMFNTSKSSIDFAKIIDEGMYVILDFGGGLPDDMVRFLGNVFMHLFYTTYRKRVKEPDGTYRPFNLYLDEVQTFSPSMIRELLNTVRKYGIKMTVATQSVSALDRDLSDEIATLCRAIACFRCDVKTAAHLKAILPCTVEKQQALSWHVFSFYSGGDSPIKAVARTRHLQVAQRWEQAARSSVERLGEFVSLEKYYNQSGGNAEVLLSPLEFGILNYLRMENRDVSRDEITKVMTRRYRTDARTVASAINDTLIDSHHFVEKHDILTDDGDSNFESRYSVTSTAIKIVFSKAASGRRAGGDMHLAMIFMIQDVQMNLGNYCVVDRGTGAARHADLLMFSPEKIRDGEGNEIAYHPHEWSKDIIAVEVETAPGKHMEQVVTNYKKNHEMGYFLQFVVFSESDKEKIVNAFRHAKIGQKEYSITVMNTGILTSVDMNSESVRQFSPIQTSIFSILLNAGGMAAEQYIIDNSWRHEPKHIMETLASMAKKGELGSEERQIQNPSNPDDPSDKKTVRMWKLAGYSSSANKKKDEEKRDGVAPKLTEDTFSVSRPEPMGLYSRDHYDPDPGKKDRGTEEDSEAKGMVRQSVRGACPQKDKDTEPEKATERNHDDIYRDLDENMLLDIFIAHDVNDEKEDMRRIREVLNVRGFCIKRRGHNNFFVAKIPKKKNSSR